MSVNEQIKELYKSYFFDTTVAYDGIVNEAEFKNQKIRTLFLLKDANPEPYEDGNAYVYRDLYETANTEDADKIKISTVTWRNVCRWAKIISNPNCSELDNYNEHGDFDVYNIRKFLNNIATVNIKKTFGKGVNENEKEYNLELTAAVADYYKLVDDEIELIDPQLIVCGGTFDYILPYYFNNKKERKASVKYLSSGARYFVLNSRIFLDFDHPGSRTSPKILFAYFKETFNALLNEAL